MYFFNYCIDAGPFGPLVYYLAAVVGILLHHSVQIDYRTSFLPRRVFIFDVFLECVDCAFLSLSGLELASIGSIISTFVLLPALDVRAFFEAKTGLIYGLAFTSCTDKSEEIVGRNILHESPSAV